ncbi:MAG: hypothetical protein E7375_01200 [Clostridiales bacterium]|nr:hypothetical protein [Clostridiales bacterium]
MERINELLIKDKFSNLEQVAELLKEEITPLALNFFLMSKEVTVRYKREGSGYTFNVEIKADRVKPFGSKIL